VPRGDAAGFIAAAEGLADDASRWAAMGRAARAAVLPLEPAQVARNLAGVLSGLARGRAA
jgi:hypothetical protein